MRILIVDDHTLVAAGLSLLLAQLHHEVAGTVRTGDEALAALETTPLDLVLLDFSVPGTDSLNALQDLRLKWPDLPILVISLWDDCWRQREAKKRGASGLLANAVRPDTLAQALTAVAAGGRWFPPLASEQFGKVSRLDPGLFVSAREYEVLCYNYHGLEYKEIAAELDISRATVDTHFRHLRKKFKVHNGRELVAKVIEHGILGSAPPPQPPTRPEGPA